MHPRNLVYTRNDSLKLVPRMWSGADTGDVGSFLSNPSGIRLRSQEGRTLVYLSVVRLLVPTARQHPRKYK